MKQLQEILKYTKDLVEQEPEKSAYWHYNKLVRKIEEAIDAIDCCESDSDQLLCKHCDNKKVLHSAATGLCPDGFKHFEAK